jgi:hypothetical protein
MCSVFSLPCYFLVKKAQRTIIKNINVAIQYVDANTKSIMFPLKSKRDVAPTSLYVESKGKAFVA